MFFIKYIFIVQNQNSVKQNIIVAQNFKKYKNSHWIEYFHNHSFRKINTEKCKEYLNGTKAFDYPDIKTAKI